MKLAIKILSYTLAIIMFLGMFTLTQEGTLDAYAFLVFVLIEAQCILTLIHLK